MAFLSLLSSFFSAEGAFPAGTRLLTEDGARRVERLAPGDRLVVHDGGSIEVEAVLRRSWIFSPLARGRRAVAVNPGALGPGLPSGPIIAGPDQQLAFRLPREEGGSCVCLPAAALAGLAGVRRLPLRRRMEVYLVRTRRTALVLVEGCMARLPASILVRLADRLSAGRSAAVVSRAWSRTPRFVSLPGARAMVRRLRTRAPRSGSQVARCAVAADCCDDIHKDEIVALDALGEVAFDTKVALPRRMADAGGTLSTASEPVSGRMTEPSVTMARRTDQTDATAAEDIHPPTLSFFEERDASAVPFAWPRRRASPA